MILHYCNQWITWSPKSHFECRPLGRWSSWRQSSRGTWGWRRGWRWGKADRLLGIQQPLHSPPGFWILCLLSKVCTVHVYELSYHTWTDFPLRSSNPGRLWVSIRSPWEVQKGTWTRRTFEEGVYESEQRCIIILKRIFTPVFVGLWKGGVTLASVSCKPGASMMQQMTVVTNKRMAYL